MSNHKNFRIAAAALSAAMIFAPLSAPAFATSTAQSAPVSLIQDDATASLHITKYLGTPTGQKNDGTQLESVTPGTPLAGVTFTAYRVTGVDLTTNEGWTAANQYYNAGTKPTALDTPVTCTTGANGAATGQCDLTGLPIGLYYVEETAAPVGTTMAQPFFVTLPMTNPTNRTEWMYDVYVYPKNQQDSITKEVVDKGTVTAEGGVTYGTAGNHLVDYKITTSITDGTDPLQMYVINDQLDPAVTFQSATVALSDGITTLTEGTDYTLTTTTGGLVTITMTPAGIATLEGKRDASVVTTITVALNAEDGDGFLPNTATFIPNKNWFDQNTGKPGIPSEEVVSKYGDLQVTKVDPKDDTKLAGAEFVVYADGNNDEACTAADVIDANKILGPVVTDAAGALTIKGLQASDWYNNAQQTDLITYCLVETKAPEGYNLQADPIQFTIGQGTVGNLSVTKRTVNNEKQNLNNQLPLTGGQGVAAMSVAGLLLVGGGVAYYAATSKKREDEEA